MLAGLFDADFLLMYLICGTLLLFGKLVISRIMRYRLKKKGLL